MDLAKQGSRELSLPLSLNTLAQGSMFWQPDHLVRSPWLEHLPLLFWLVEALQPEQCVILGDAEGGAHLGVCQALSRLKLNTACYLVAENEASAQAQEEARRRYGGVAQRLESTPLRALAQFEPGQTDLLIVNTAQGEGGGEELIERWRSRLSPRGVVVMTGVARREPGCEAFRTFDSLKQRTPHVAFPHADGLGLLMLGNEVTPLLERLLSTWETPQSARVVQDVFARLGRGCLDQLDAEQERSRAEKLSEQLESQRQRAQRANKSLEQQRGEFEQRERELEQAKQQLALLEERRTHERGHLAEQVSHLQQSRDSLAQELQALKHRLEGQHHEAAQQATELANLRAERQLHVEQVKRLEETTEARSELALQAHRFELERLQAELAQQVEKLEEASQERQLLGQKLKCSGEEKLAQEQQLQQREQALAEAEARADKLQQQLKRERGDSTARVADMQAEQERLVEALKRAEADKAQLAPKLNELVAEQIERAALLERLEGVKEEQAQQLSQLQETLKAERSERAREQATWQQEQVDKEATIAACLEELTALSETLKATEQGRQRLQSESEETQRALHQLGDSLEREEAEKTELGQQLSQMQGTLDAERSERGRLQAEWQQTLDEKEASIVTRFEELATLTQMLETADADKTELGQQLSQVQGTLDAERSERGRLQAEWQQTLDEKEASIATRFEELATLTQMLEAGDAEKQSIQAELEAARKQANNQGAECKQLEHKNRALVRDKEALDKNLTQLQDTLNAERRERDTMRAEWERRIREQQKEVETRFEELAILTQMLEEKDQQLAALNGEEDRVVHSLEPQPKRKLRFLGEQRQHTRKLKREAAEIESSGYFDKSWYLQMYPDVASDTRFNNKPAQHYLKFGGFEGRNPGPNFDSQGYLDENPDVAVTGINPLLHYIRDGKKEGRSPLPDTVRE